MHSIHTASHSHCIISGAERVKVRWKERRSVEKKQRPTSHSEAVEIELVLENVTTELEVVAGEDAELNQLLKPTINKLKKLRNINVRVAILKILDDLPIDLKQHHRRQHFKRSGLGKVVMFLSESDEETTTNRKLAKELVDKWALAEKGLESECIETIQAINVEPYPAVYSVLQPVDSGSNSFNSLLITIAETILSTNTIHLNSFNSLCKLVISQESIIYGLNNLQAAQRNNATRVGQILPPAQSVPV